MSNFSDTELALELASKLTVGRPQVLVVANTYLARVLVRDSSTSVWVELGQGEFGTACKDALASAIRTNRVSWLSTTEPDPTTVNYAAAPHQIAKTASINQWLVMSGKVTGTGRQGDVDDKTKAKVGAAAGWRCQFEGCGEDLSNHNVPGAAGNYSYFAHIIASSSDGPRGDPVESPKLAKDPSNVMLMCDKCHRLIDRIAPTRYGVQRLREMRRKNLEEVQRLLGTLRFGSAQPVVIGGSIEGQPFVFDERVADEAMWLGKLRATTPRPDPFARNGHLGASNTDGYWLSIFELLRNDAPRLKSMLQTMANGSTPLAIFPLHGTSVLALFGRLVGESSAVHLFQFQRDQVAGNRGGQWAWPDNPKPPADKFKVRELKARVADEAVALLRINLTAAPPAVDLPENLFANGEYVLPTVEVTVEAPSYRVIGHPDDLEQVGRAIGEALQLLQDSWRVRTIHLVVVAPTTACFRLGQKMQARHHADFVLYERLPATEPGKSGRFAPTIHIRSQQAVLATTGAAVSIS